MTEGDSNRSKMTRTLWSDLPYDLLSRIADGLGLIEFLSFRGVCKDWQNASSKASPEAKSLQCDPWFLVYGEGSQCSLLSNRDKIYTINIPELDGATCLASYGGWLLLFRHGSMFFFCPFSRAKIELPKCPFSELSDHIAAFSSVPTSEDCIVAVIRRSSDHELELHLLFRGHDQWTEHKYRCHLANLNTIRCAVYCEGAFEFSDSVAGLVSFDAKTKQWRTYIVKAYGKHFHPLNYISLKWFVEKNMGRKLGLEANVSISTCGALIRRSNALDILIQSENFQGFQGPESRHLKGVWIQPKYFQISPDHSW